MGRITFGIGNRILNALHWSTRRKAKYCEIFDTMPAIQYVRYSKPNTERLHNWKLRYNSWIVYIHYLTKSKMVLGFYHSVLLITAWAFTLSFWMNTKSGSKSYLQRSQRVCLRVCVCLCVCMCVYVYIYKDGRAVFMYFMYSFIFSSLKLNDSFLKA